jgi:hypothetical protein
VAVSAAATTIVAVPVIGAARRIIQYDGATTIAAVTIRIGIVIAVMGWHSACHE